MLLSVVFFFFKCCFVLFLLGPLFLEIPIGVAHLKKIIKKKNLLHKQKTLLIKHNENANFQLFLFVFSFNNRFQCFKI